MKSVGQSKHSFQCKIRIVPEGCFGERNFSLTLKKSCYVISVSASIFLGYGRCGKKSLMNRNSFVLRSKSFIFSWII